MKRQKTITSIMTYIFLGSILTQVFLLLSILYVGRVPDKIIADSYNDFNIDLEESITKLENYMTEKLRFGEFRDHFNEIILEDINSVDDVFNKSDLELNIFFEKHFSSLIDLIGLAPVASAYFILENSEALNNGKLIRDGIYLAYIKEEIDIVKSYKAKVTRDGVGSGLPHIDFTSSDNNFILDSIKKEDSYYFHLQDTTLSNNGIKPIVNIINQAYLASDVINISYPLYDSNNMFLGVIGIDVLINDLYHIVHTHPEITYVLGMQTGEDLIINPELVWGNDIDINVNENIMIKKGSADDNYYQLENSRDYTIYYSKLNFEHFDSSFYNGTSWVILGIIETSSLIASARYIEHVILLIIIFSIIIGGILIWIMITRIVNPIKELAEKVDNRPRNEYIVFEKTKIVEINNLITAFENLTYDTLQYSNKLRSAMNTLVLGIYIYKNDEDVVFCNQSFLDLFQSNLKEGYISKEEFEKLYNSLISNQYYSKFEAFKLPNNRWVRLDNKMDHIYTHGIITDVTDQIEEVKKIEQVLEIDVFTKLYNKFAFQKLASEMIEANEEKIFAILMWDMDRLKYINDRYGHDVGDDYILKFASVIEGLNEYGGIVARRSGDEFYGLLMGDDRSDIEDIIDIINNRIATSKLEISDGISEDIKASIGVAWYPEDGHDLKNLLVYADRELYRTKYETSNITSYSEIKNKQYTNVFHYINEFERIIAGDYLTFAFQPIIDVENAEIFAYEMLLRTFSEIIPTTKLFIDLARETNKLQLVNELAFSKLIDLYSEVKEKINSKRVFINYAASIKVSSKNIKKLKKVAGSDLSFITMELQDTFIVSEEEVISKVTSEEKHGYSFALDQFKFDDIEKYNFNFNFKYLKVDVKIINNLASSENERSRLIEIIKFAKKKKMKVIAVGVSSEEQLEIAITCGVDYVQGFYIAAPTVAPNQVDEKIINKIRKLSRK